MCSPLSLILDIPFLGELNPFEPFDTFLPFPLPFDFPFELPDLEGELPPEGEALALSGSC